MHSRDTVETGLIAAFRLLPGRPCMTIGPRLVEGHAPALAVEVFGWVDQFVPSLDERKALLTWARCRAGGESAWDDLCKRMNWPKRTMEDRRVRAANRIAAGLNGEVSQRTSLSGMVAALAESGAPT